MKKETIGFILTIPLILLVVGVFLFGSGAMVWLSIQGNPMALLMLIVTLALIGAQIMDDDKNITL